MMTKKCLLEKDQFINRVHGGDREGFFARYGVKPLDFSASISPLGMPERAREAAIAALSGEDGYPDPECRALRAKLAEQKGLKSEYILCGNGASDLIDRLAWALRPRQALVTAPTYGEYRLALERTGCEVSEYRLREEDDFRLGEDFLGALSSELDVVFLCDPNNPTGLAAGRELLEKIAGRCDELDILLVLDECFIDFLDNSGTPSVRSTDAANHFICEQIKPYERPSACGRAAVSGQTDPGTMLNRLEHHRMLILRAFTKFYGFAGLRLGWCACADTALLTRMKLAGQPWAVSAPAMAAGLAALTDTGHGEALRSMIVRERRRLFDALKLCGCRVIPGEANFLLFQTSRTALDRELAEQGILIRSCREFHGLGEGWFRIAVRTPEENDRLIMTMTGLFRGL